LSKLFQREPGNNMRRKLKINFAETIFFILIIPLAVFVLLVSPLFQISRIAVEGNREISTDEIISMAGIVLGDNILKIDLSRASAQIETIPMIKEADIERKFPSHLCIRVVERKPIALLPTREGYLAVDADGVCCRKAQVGEKGLPVITGLDDENNLLEGQALQNPKLSLALSFIEKLPVDVVADLSEINPDENGQVILFTLQGIRCLMGAPENVNQKGILLKQVLEQLNDKQVEYIDLSLSGSPVVKMKD
jgi:cell division protein FtsQ